jgi:hypothetical protein
MPRFARSFPFLAAAALCGAAAVVVFRPGEAESGTPVPGALKTHFGTAATDVVVLQLVGQAGSRTFARVMPDGSTQLGWRAPAGTMFFATDVEGASGWGNAMQSPYLRALRLQIVNDADPVKRVTVMYPAPLPENFVTNTTRLYDFSVARAQVGFMLAPGAHIEADAPMSINTDGDLQTGPYLGDVLIRGYLVRSK